MFSEIYCVVKGRVQGVGYRDFIDRYAKDHNLFGWIRNKEDGSVELVLQGTPDELKDCIEILNQGSLLAKVEVLAVDWRTPEKQYTEFRVMA
jgi:acylphosphatase